MITLHPVPCPSRVPSKLATIRPELVDVRTGDTDSHVPTTPPGSRECHSIMQWSIVPINQNYPANRHFPVEAALMTWCTLSG